PKSSSRPEAGSCEVRPLLRRDKLEVCAPGEGFDRRRVELTPLIERLAGLDHDRERDPTGESELKLSRSGTSYILSLPVGRPRPLVAVRPVPRALAVDDHGVLALALNDQEEDPRAVDLAVLRVERALDRDQSAAW